MNAEGWRRVRGRTGATAWIAMCLALAASACTSASADGAATVTMRVAHVSASQPNVWRANGRGWAVTLDWSALDGHVESYAVLRDGNMLKEGLSATTFVDRSVVPGKRYVYSVIGVDTARRRTRPGTVTVKTHRPSVRGGRLGGVFITRLQLLRSHGLATAPTGGAFTFVFRPRCRSGPCTVRWRVGERQTSGRLGWRHGVYVGLVKGPFQIRSCTGATIDEGLRVRLRVTAAALVGEDWRATRFRGTLAESVHAPGCAQAGITWRLRGAVQT
jgi:hypothetical protein